MGGGSRRGWTWAECAPRFAACADRVGRELGDLVRWAEGYTKRFGLAAVEFTSPTKERTLRPSAYVYRDIVRANAVADVPDLSARRGSS